MASSDDPFNLERFTRAQEPVIGQVMEELNVGQKRSHWMWFVFPQLRGLGSSSTAHEFGIGSLEEARAYMGHPVLGPRLIDCTRAVVNIEGRSLSGIFGSPDDMKFCSSMTLFAIASESEKAFQAAIDRFCGGRLDQHTQALLER